MNKLSKALFIIFIVWLISMAIRWPNLGRPLSKHHEFCTAVVLRIYDIWKLEGFDECRGLPIMNYPGEENKWINNFASGSGKMHDSKGNYYYVSHPPLAYYIPYVWLNILGLELSLINLQLWHCVIHFSCALLLFLLIKTISSYEIALLSSIFYLLNGVSLWFQSNTYMSDMLVQLYFISSILAYTKLREKYSFLKLVWLFISIGQMVYCSWLGYFTATAIIFHAFYTRKYWKRVSLIVLTSVSIFSSIFILQYSKINGFSALVDEWMQRGGERAGFQMENLVAILKNYVIHYGPIFLLLLIFYQKIEWRKYRSILFLFCTPILLLHLFLSNYSVHDFTVLHALYPLSFLLAVAIYSLKPVITKIALAICMTAIFIIQYYFMNLPGEQNYRGVFYDKYQRKGYAIAQERENDHVLFLWKEKIEPQASYYAKCNVKSVNSQAEVKEFLSKRNGLKGKILYFDEEQIIKAEKIK